VRNSHPCLPAEDLSQSRSRIFRPADVELDELDPTAGLDEADEIRHDVLHGMMGSAAGEAKALVHEVEASLPVAGPKFGDVLHGEGRVGGDLGGEELGLDVGTDIGIAIVGC